MERVSSNKMKPSKRLKGKSPYLHKQKCDDVDNEELNDGDRVACEGAMRIPCRR
ncbi:NMDA receptor synaptonuclear signaling and neuronal migration [Sesbania bispinosa]|nr:NMDA receptor synaptonuclear signaling and neuronal migration [Sesbania bispinosa]